MVENKDWRTYASIMSDPEFDRVIAEIQIFGLDHLKDEAVGFLSYDGGDDDVRVHLFSNDNIPLPALLEAIEKGRKALLGEE